MCVQDVAVRSWWLTCHKHLSFVCTRSIWCLLFSILFTTSLKSDFAPFEKKMCLWGERMCICVCSGTLCGYTYMYMWKPEKSIGYLYHSQTCLLTWGFPLSLELTDSVYMASDPRDPPALTLQLSWLQTQLTSPGCSHVFWDPNSGLLLMQQTLRWPVHLPMPLAPENYVLASLYK